MIQTAYAAIEGRLERSPLDDWDTVRNKLSAAMAQTLFDDLAEWKVPESNDGEK
jgi:hypothetical protein